VFFLITQMSNPYVDQICQQTAESPSEVRRLHTDPGPFRFPRMIYGRRYETYEEYLEELHEFLNGN